MDAQSKNKLVMHIAFSVLILLGLILLPNGAGHALALLSGGQASFTSTLSLDAISNKKITAWSLQKSASAQTLVDPNNATIAFPVVVTEGVTKHVLNESYTLSLTNSGSAPAYIASFVVNVQKKLPGTKFATVASVIADRANPPRQGVPTCFGSFSNSPAAQSIQIIDAQSNDVIALADVPAIQPGETKVFTIATVFDADLLGLAEGTQIRKEVLTTFENAGPRGKSGDLVSCTIDADGDGKSDDARTIASRVSTQIPPLVTENATVQLADLITHAADPLIVAVPDFVMGQYTLLADGSAPVNATIQATGVSGTQTLLTAQSTASCNPANDAGGSSSVENTAVLSGDNPAYIAGSPASAQIAFTCSPAKKPAIKPGDFKTFTQGGWGAAPKGGNPGTVLKNNFTSIYPAGVEVGIPGTGGFSMKFTSTKAVELYLPQGGAPNTLTADLVNPLSSSSGVFGGQVLALQLNMDFSAAGATLAAGGLFGNLQLCNTGTSLDGQSVAHIRAVANTALGGGALPGDYSISAMNDLVTNLNESFDSGNVVSSWAGAHLCLP